MTEKDAVAFALNDSPPHHGLPQSRYPSSRWQQLKQSIAARDGAHADILGSYHGLTAAGAKEVKISCVDQDLLEPDAATSIQQEAAGVLQRITDTNYPVLVHNDKSSSLAIQPDGTITSNSRYQGLLDSSIAEFSSFSLLLPYSSTGQPLAGAGLSPCAVDTDPQQQLSEGKSPAKHAALQQLKHQRQQAQPRQVSGGRATGTVVTPLKVQHRASTARLISASHVSLRLRASGEVLGKQPAPAHSAKHLSSSFTGSWPDIGSRSSTIREQTGQQATVPVINGSPPDLIIRATALTADTRKSVTAIAADSADRASITTAATHKHPLLSETDSYALDSSLVHELQQELADQMLHKIVRRWQQANADVQLDRARARPMQKLLRSAPSHRVHLTTICLADCAIVKLGSYPDYMQLCSIRHRVLDVY